jgi:hypothetical protein
VATTELPMTPMVAERPVTVAATSPAEQPAGASPPAQTPKPAIRRRLSADAQQQGIYRPDYYYYRRQSPVQQGPFSFQSLFGGSNWFRR